MSKLRHLSESRRADEEGDWRSPLSPVSEVLKEITMPALYRFQGSERTFEPVPVSGRHEQLIPLDGAEQRSDRLRQRRHLGPC